MPYVITSLCTNDGACVEVCPVACIHTMPGAAQFYIDPDVCIDCEQCEIVCPVAAIFKDVDTPAEHAASIEVNAGFFRRHKAVRGPVPVQSAWEMVHRAHAYAEANGLKVAAVVLGGTRCPLVVGGMGGADPHTAQAAFNQDYTAAAFPMGTSELVPQARQHLLRRLFVFHHTRM